MKQFRAVWICLLLCFVHDIGHAQSSAYSRVLAQAQADLSAGKTAQALDDSRKAIALDPSGWGAHLVAAAALETEKKFDEAGDEYLKALEKAPEEKKAG